MDRREFLKRTIAIYPVASGCSRSRPVVDGAAQRIRRVRPGDRGWPSDARWAALKQAVHGRLIKPNPGMTAEVFARLKNPFYIGDQPALTQTSAWIDAWASAPSVYAVAAAQTTDVVAAVNFAREHNLRLVVKGGGHSYQGTSNAADSLLIWTRAMNSIVIHDEFVPRGCARPAEPQRAVSVGAGAIWMHVYDAVTTGAGRYVQGGGCTTVGVAGLVQSGGFGSFSKNYGLASAGLLEAEVVTADGAVRITNACTNPDLFWALKGGGGGSFGVVTRLVLRTRDLPDYFGGVFGTIQASSEAVYHRLTARVLDFYRDRLFNPNWGEQIRFEPGNIIRIAMVFQGLERQSVEELWRPVRQWVADAPNELAWDTPLQVVSLPARHFWDSEFLRQNAAAFIIMDDRPGASERNFIWAGDRGDSGQILYGYRSTWLPSTLLETDRRGALVDALVAGSRHWTISLHFNKGLAGGRPEALAAARDTAVNPAVLDAFALAIIAGNGPAAFPGLAGHEPNLAASRRHAQAIDRAMTELSRVVPQPSSYVSESDFFETAWQQSFWGSNYPRLAAVKKTYDPTGLFFVHHGVGSDEWSADGFARTSPY